MQDYGRPETTPCEGESLDKFSFERKYFDAVLRIAQHVRDMTMCIIQYLIQYLILRQDRELALTITQVIQFLAPNLDLLSVSVQYHSK